MDLCFNVPCLVSKHFLLYLQQQSLNLEIANPAPIPFFLVKLIAQYFINHQVLAMFWF